MEFILRESGANAVRFVGEVRTPDELHSALQAGDGIQLSYDSSQDKAWTDINRITRDLCVNFADIVDVLADCVVIERLLAGKKKGRKRLACGPRCVCEMVWILDLHGVNGFQQG